MRSSYYTYGSQNVLDFVPPGPPAQYKCIRQHWVGPFTGETTAVYHNVGDILVEGVDVPLGWVPTLAVDPLNSNAAGAFWNAGPRDAASATSYDLDLWPLGSMQVKPVTYWVQTPPPPPPPPAQTQVTTFYVTYGPQNIAEIPRPVTPATPVTPPVVLRWVLTGLGASFPVRGP